jgi:hypothetical protein
LLECIKEVYKYKSNYSGLCIRNDNDYIVVFELPKPEAKFKEVEEYKKKCPTAILILDLKLSLPTLDLLINAGFNLGGSLEQESEELVTESIVYNLIARSGPYSSEIVQKLINTGARVNPRRVPVWHPIQLGLLKLDYSQPILYHAIINWRPRDDIRLLINKGADLCYYPRSFIVFGEHPVSLVEFLEDAKTSEKDENELQWIKDVIELIELRKALNLVEQDYKATVSDQLPKDILGLVESFVPVGKVIDDPL